MCSIRTNYFLLLLLYFLFVAPLHIGLAKTAKAAKKSHLQASPVANVWLKMANFQLCRIQNPYFVHFALRFLITVGGIEASTHITVDSQRLH